MFLAVSKVGEPEGQSVVIEQARSFRTYWLKAQGSQPQQNPSGKIACVESTIAVGEVQGLLWKVRLPKG
jgi:hypothetical protein